MRKKIRGVNLGGWLVLEKWMTPALFEGTSAKDETDYSAAITPVLYERLIRHHATFITRDDIAWIASHGINTLRLPVPHWLFGDVPPYVRCDTDVRCLLDWASEFRLDVMIDLHCAPGCQNGFDNGGITGVIDWPKDPLNIQRTLDVLHRICALCKPYACVTSIELLNEPHQSIDLDLIKDFYLRGYEIIRKWYHPGECTVVMHDSFRPGAWQGFMVDDHYQDVLMDAHFYQFTDENRELDYFGHAETTLVRQREEYALLMAEHAAIVGEWSLGYPLEFVQKLSCDQREIALRGFAANQLAVYEQGQGWIFWSYKVESDMAPWSYRECVERGWLPVLGEEG
jgi:glucan 1,3-beta-glucosidase